jgi:hypothetical protein
MAVTSTQSSMGVRSNRAVGRYIDTGTAAAFTITTGFKPRVVRVYDVDSGDMLEWFEGMAAASARKTLGANGNVSLITTLGITVSEHGFTVGLDTDVNVTSEQISWVAEG